MYQLMFNLVNTYWHDRVSWAEMIRLCTNKFPPHRHIELPLTKVLSSRSFIKDFRV